jgi:hypothetical protein
MAIVLSPPLDPLPRPSQFFSPLHSGIDWPGLAGTPILAAAAGTVTYAQWGGGGLEVRIDHGQGVETRYLHLQALLVGRGQPVRVGQRIGLMGSTGVAFGTHLHFELVVSGTKVNPLPYMTGLPNPIGDVGEAIGEQVAEALRIKVELGDVAPVILNGAILVSAALLAWSGLQRILGR